METSPIQPYNEETYQQLINDGIDPFDAMRIASTEMEGAPENKNGINSRQTYCQELHYNETTGQIEPHTPYDPFQIDEDSDEIIYNNIYS